jgi:hypothetical protein
MTTGRPPAENQQGQLADACRPSRKRTLASVLVACYLLGQLGLPLIVVARPGHTWRDFSWDMFSHRLSCSKLDAVARPRGGTWGTVQLSRDFSSWAQVSRVLVPARLEAYARYLCRILRTELGRDAELHFIAECHEDRQGPTFHMADEKRDYCAGN